jgi:hypothetical protein
VCWHMPARWIEGFDAQVFAEHLTVLWLGWLIGAWSEYGLVSSELRKIEADMFEELRRVSRIMCYEGSDEVVGERVGASADRHGSSDGFYKVEHDFAPR